MDEELLKLISQEKTEGKELSDEEMEEIVSTYLSGIILPAKLEKQIILCPVGLVGAGKTTVLKPISEKLGLLRISMDEIREILIKKGFNLVRTLEMAVRIIDNYIKLGFSLAIDADCITIDVQNYLNSIKSKTGAKLIWIHINPPEEFMINKLNNYKHGALFKDAKEALYCYERRKPLHKEFLPKMSFCYEFDTSKNNIDQQIENFLDLIKKDLK